MNNYLIIQTAFLGDVVLALSMGGYIKSMDEAANIIFVTTAASEPIAANCPYIDQVIVYDKYSRDKGINGIWKLARRLNANNYEAVFTPHRSFRSSILTRLISTGRKYGFDKSALSFLFEHVIHYEPADHEIERNLSLVRAHWNDTGRELILPVISVAVEKTKAIAIAPGSVWATKRWPVEKWVELVSSPELADREIVIIGSGDDREIADEIEIKSGNKNVTNLVGKLSIIESIGRIAECQLIVSNDSAPQHFAVAVGTPVITIFGATVPRFGFYPVGPHDKVVETDLNLPCRPCGIHGLRNCKIKTFDCMNSIEVGKVIEAVKSIEK